MREIIATDADVMALQEVTPAFYDYFLQQKHAYSHCVFHQYAGEDEGLAILSKYPLAAQEHLAHLGCRAQHILLQCGGAKFSFTNVHLPWDSAKEKEKQIVAIDQYIHRQAGAADYFILLGDFNSGVHSSVHRFLTGEQTLRDEESKPYWLDILGNYNILHDLPLPPTIDCIHNPRWKGKNTIYAPDNNDRIYVMDNWAPMEFVHADIFGTAVSPVNGLSASDHYGVVVEGNFTKNA